MDSQAAPPAKKFTSIERPYLVIVEGPDDQRFFQAFARHIGLPDIQCEYIEGRTNLRGVLKTLSTTPGHDKLTSLGVVRDADEDPDAALQSIRDALKAAWLPVPKKVLAPVGEAPRVTVMILPGRGRPGMLETLCLEAVAHDPAMACVDGYFECLEARGLATPTNMAKARVHTFLASRKEPELRLGEASDKGYWPWEAEAFEQVREFLRLVVS